MKKQGAGNVFTSARVAIPKSSTFDLSYNHITSCRMGHLIPIHIQECVPADTFYMKTTGAFRLMPMTAPPFANIQAYVHHFFVPYRLLWPNWQKFISPENTTITPPSFPRMPVGVGDELVVGASSLSNYLGIRVCTIADVDMRPSAMPYAAYQKIYSDWYRDQNLDPDEFKELIDGDQLSADADILQILRPRAWEHDYFTSCLPWAQKGSAVNIPIEFTGTFEVHLNENSLLPTQVKVTGTGNAPATDQDLYAFGTSGDLTNSAGSQTFQIDPNGNLYVNGSSFTGANISTMQDLRRAASLQRFLEKMAITGSRYYETILANFGVRTSDARLQRSEYLGGSRATVAISEVLQTSESAATPQGNMAGHGIAMMDGYDTKYQCEEHGFIISLLSIMPQSGYYQGIHKLFYKFDKFDYLWPDFAQIGEEPVKNYELYYDPLTMTPIDANNTFGYLPRYTDYRYNNSRVSGEMATTLDYWHMYRKFTDLPNLNNDFIACNPTDRVFADTSPSDKVVAYIYHNITGNRKLPYFGNGGGTL